MKSEVSKKILLVGNPNVGKSTIFNALCNRKQKTGNYSGVTVASHTGEYQYQNELIEIVDLPGSYSIHPTSEDEVILSNFVIDNKDSYQGIVYIVEALSLRRGLLLLQQLQDLQLPIFLVVNQMDQAEKKGISIDFDKLSEDLGVTIIQTDAKHNRGIDQIRQAIFENKFSISTKTYFEIPSEYHNIIENQKEKSGLVNNYQVWAGIIDGKIVTENSSIVPKRLQAQEAVRRYQGIDKIIAGVLSKTQNFKELVTEKIDKILVHKFWGYVIFVAILLLIFESVFFLAQFPMGWIESAFGGLAEFTKSHLPEGPLASLLADGVIAGVGGIAVFAPQIGILLFFLYMLEDSGYMARIIYLMDRFLKPFGLNGKSVIPLVSGTACAIPAIMSARNIENTKERLITVLVTPFMTCSARLPVYSIIIALVIPEGVFLGLSYKALTLTGMYLLGFGMALLVSLVLKYVIKSTGKSYLVMDLPTYKTPLFWYNFKMALSKVWEFFTRAGSIIFVISILIWVFSYFGPSPEKEKFVASNVELEKSYLGIAGKAMEPAIAPLGYDWKMGVGVLTSFAAREVFVGTISTLYALSSDADENTLIEKMQSDVKPNGEKVFSFATGISILIFYAFAMQCVSTIAIVYRETMSYKWTIIQFVGMTALAVIGAFFAYQLLK